MGTGKPQSASRERTSSGSSLPRSLARASFSLVVMTISLSKALASPGSISAASASPASSASTRAMFDSISISTLAVGAIDAVSWAARVCVYVCMRVCVYAYGGLGFHSLVGRLEAGDAITWLQSTALQRNRCRLLLLGRRLLLVGRRLLLVVDIARRCLDGGAGSLLGSCFVGGIDLAGGRGARGHEMSDAPVLAHEPAVQDEIKAVSVGIAHREFFDLEQLQRPLGESAKISRWPHCDVVRLEGLGRELPGDVRAQRPDRLRLHLLVVVEVIGARERQTIN